LKGAPPLEERKIFKGDRENRGDRENGGRLRRK
jgi:hypothetical protein